ncbi:MAG: hypothetical protein IT324_16210 [Anaerolineae bacterium]|nr:hypothetical protein [Anaerolineae bacterium]
MSVQPTVADREQPHLSSYRELPNADDYGEAIAVADSGDLVKGIRSGLAIMIPFYAIVAGIFLLIKNH